MRLRQAEKFPPPYKLNEIPTGAVREIAQAFLFKRLIINSMSLEGPEWEQIFADAINAEWKPSNIGLDDIQLKNCAWGAKTIKSTRPFSQDRARLISGRNSLAFSYDIDSVRTLPPNDVGTMILGIWNARVGQVRARFNHVRTAVLLKGPDLLSGAVFELETLLAIPETVEWRWNVRKNLEGFIGGIHRYTWQPHGSQFTIIEDIPHKRFGFRLNLPREVVRMDKMELVKACGFEESWITIVTPE